MSEACTGVGPDVGVGEGFGEGDGLGDGLGDGDGDGLGEADAQANGCIAVVIGTEPARVQTAVMVYVPVGSVTERVTVEDDVVMAVAPLKYCTFQLDPAGFIADRLTAQDFSVTVTCPLTAQLHPTAKRHARRSRRMGYTACTKYSISNDCGIAAELVNVTAVEAVTGK